MNDNSEEKKPTYKTVPLDEQTHERLMTLCDAYGLGRRSQGAFVRRLIDEEWRKLEKVKLLGPAAAVEPRRRRKTDDEAA